MHTVGGSCIRWSHSTRTQGGIPYAIRELSLWFVERVFCVFRESFDLTGAVLWIMYRAIVVRVLWTVIFEL